MRHVKCSSCGKLYDRDTFSTCPWCKGLGKIPRVSEAPKNKVPQKGARGKAVKGKPMGAEITEYLKTHGTRATVTKYKGKVSKSEIYKIAGEEENKARQVRMSLREIYEIAGIELDKEFRLKWLDKEGRWVELVEPREPKPKKGKVFSRIVVDTWEKEAYGVELVYSGKGQPCTLDSVIEEELHRAKGNASKRLE